MSQPRPLLRPGTPGEVADCSEQVPRDQTINTTTAALNHAHTITS